MSMIASGVMGLFGMAYCAMGMSMLVPGLDRWGQMSTLYPSLFKRFLREPGGESDKESDIGAGTRDASDLQREDLAFRQLAYLLLLLGACRVASALYWGCGYVFLGLGTCFAEMAFVGHELLRHETVLLHRAMAVLSELCVLSLVYIGSALPYCHC